MFVARLVKLAKTVGLRFYYEYKHFRSFLRIIRDVNPLLRSRLSFPNLVLKDGTVIRISPSYYDYLVFWENFCVREYEKYLPEGFEPRVILDLGAHKGFFSLAIHQRFPHAAIYALEPDAANYRTLVENTTHIPQIHPMNVAVWKERGQMTLHQESSNSVSHSLVERGSADGSQMTETITMDDLPKADFIKCDIEGAEHELVFNAPYLALEVHDRGQGLDVAIAEFRERLQKDGYRVIAEEAIMYGLRA